MSVRRLICAWAFLAALGVACGRLASAQAVSWRDASANLDVTRVQENFQNVYFCAWASRQALPCTNWEACVDRAMREAGFTRTAFPRTSRGADWRAWSRWVDTQCYVASNDALVLVTFRGTEHKAEDFVTDARWVPVCEGEDRAVKVHSGFQAGLNAVWPGLKEEVQQAWRREDGTLKPIWVTGHSLGGSLATLAALRLAKQLPEPGGETPQIVAYTFGSPRVGNRAFTAAFQQAVPVCYRLVHNSDIVPHVPTTWMGYDHVEKGYYYDRQFHRIAPQTVADLARRVPEARNSTELVRHLGGLAFGVAPNLREMYQSLFLSAAAGRFKEHAPELPGVLRRQVTGQFEDHHLEGYLRAAYLSIPEPDRGKWPAP